MVIATASVTVAFLATAFLPSGADPTWLALLPSVFVVGWAYLLLARRGDATYLRAFLVLAVGSIVGPAFNLADVFLFYRAGGTWCGLCEAGAGLNAGVVFREFLGRAIPYWIVTPFAAAVLVKAERRLPRILGSILLGAAAGLGQAAFIEASPACQSAIGYVIGFGALYGVFLPLLAYLGDELHPLADRSRRRFWPPIFYTWVLPPLAMLVGAIAMPGRWLETDFQSGLVPAIPAINFVRSLQYGLPAMNIIQHTSICLIAIALGVSLCASGRWSWLPWVVWFLHDAVCLILAALALRLLLLNLSATSSGCPDGRTPLVTWPVFSLLIGLTYVFAFRAWCLTRRGVRPA
jgi:hypothetical protein